jgi:hypothetical protein
MICVLAPGQQPVSRFDGTTVLDAAKFGILGGSLLAGIVGAVVVRRGTSIRRFVGENE